MAPSTEARSAMLPIQDAVSSLQRTEEGDPPCQKDDDLSKALYEVFKRIPHVRGMMQQVVAFIRGKKPKEETAQDKAGYQQIIRIANGCLKRTKELEKIFVQVADIEDDAELKKTYKSVVGKGLPVEALMKTVIVSVLEVAEKCPGCFREEEVETLKETLKAIDGLAPSLEQDLPGAPACNNWGSGQQNLHFGSGHQNINNSPLPQFIGTFQAPFHFQMAPGAFQATGGTGAASEY